MALDLGGAFNAMMHFAPVAAQAYGGRLQGEQVAEQQRTEEQERKAKEARAQREMDQRQAEIDLEKQNQEFLREMARDRAAREAKPYDAASDPDVLQEEELRRRRLGRYAPAQRAPADTVPYNPDTDPVLQRAQAMRDRGLSGSTGRPPTEMQSRMRVTLPRAEEAVDRLEEFIKEHQGVPASTWADRVTPGRFFQPADVQAYNQAARAAASAVLRIESGAAISESEVENYAQQFIPQPGDKPEVIEEKLRALRITLQEMRQMAGGESFSAPGGEAVSRAAPPRARSPVAIHAAGAGHGANTSDADLWEQLVASGKTAEEATALVRQRRGQ